MNPSLFGTDTRELLKAIRKSEVQWSHPVPAIRHTTAADQQAFDKLYEAIQEIGEILKQGKKSGRSGYKSAINKALEVFERVN